MPAKIPEIANRKHISGLELLHCGKVRDMYELPGLPEFMLVVTTDRVSAHDEVLPGLVLNKGALLAAFTNYWRTLPSIRDVCHHDVVAVGTSIDELLPEHLRANVDLQTRASIVRRINMIPVEWVMRGHLTGSAWKDYCKGNREFWGCTLPDGMRDGDALPMPILTPTTKSDEGDESMTLAEAHGAPYGDRCAMLARMLYETGKAHAAERGIVIADTKFEFGELNGELFLADEVLTPDSSRFWLLRDLEVALKTGTAPVSYDKEPVRGWLSAQDDIPSVVPEEVLLATTARYRLAFSLLTGMKLEWSQQKVMGIPVELPEVNVDVVIGSESDYPQIQGTVNVFDAWRAGDDVGRIRIHTISCHRNPNELHQYVKELDGVDVIVAGAGLAAALPGIIKALLRSCGKDIPVIGVAFESNGNERGNDAARLSIEELPGQPVILNDGGRAFFGPAGFYEACLMAVSREFPPDSPTTKPARLSWKVWE